MSEFHKTSQSHKQRDLRIGDQVQVKGSSVKGTCAKFYQGEVSISVYFPIELTGKIQEYKEAQLILLNSVTIPDSTPVQSPTLIPLGREQKPIHSSQWQSRPESLIIVQFCPLHPYTHPSDLKPIIGVFEVKGRAEVSPPVFNPEVSNLIEYQSQTYCDECGFPGIWVARNPETLEPLMSWCDRCSQREYEKVQGLEQFKKLMESQDLETLQLWHSARIFDSPNQTVATLLQNYLEDLLDF